MIIGKAHVTWRDEARFDKTVSFNIESDDTVDDIGAAICSSKPNDYNKQIGFSIDFDPYWMGYRWHEHREAVKAVKNHANKTESKLLSNMNDAIKKHNIDGTQ